MSTNSLEILDLGNNQFASMSDIEVLAKCRRLHQLSLRGNPVSELDGFAEQVLLC